MKKIQIFTETLRCVYLGNKKMLALRIFNTNDDGSKLHHVCNLFFRPGKK